MAFFSAATILKGGFLGVIAAILVVTGITLALCRGCGNSHRGFGAMLVCVAFAILLTGTQMTVMLLMLINDAPWIYGDEGEEDGTSRRAMLTILLLAYGCGLSIRVVVAVAVARIWKGEGNGGRVRPLVTNTSTLPHTSSVAVGVPVALAVGTVTMPGRALPEAREGGPTEGVMTPRTRPPVPQSLVADIVPGSPPRRSDGGWSVPVPDGALLAADVVPGSQNISLHSVSRIEA